MAAVPECEAPWIKDTDMPHASTDRAPTRLITLLRRPTEAGVGSLVFLLLILGLSACAVPNVKPFSDATTAYRNAIAAAGATTVDAVRHGTEPDQAATVAALWADRLRAGDALVFYAGALTAIVEAHGSAATSVQQLSDTVSGLVAFIPGGTGAAAKEGIAIGAIIGQTAIEVKAAHDLAAAVQKAQPAVTKMADLLKKDLKDLQLLCGNAYVSSDLALVDAWRVNNKAYYDKLLVAVTTARTTAATQAFDTASVARLTELERLLAVQATALLQYQGSRRTLAVQKAAADEMFDQAIAGSDDWVKTHAEIATAIRENRVPNMTVLMVRTQEIKNAVDRIRTR